MRPAIEDIIKERACIEHEEGKLQILTNLIKDSILTIQGAAKRIPAAGRFSHCGAGKL